MCEIRKAVDFINGFENLSKDEQKKVVNPVRKGGAFTQLPFLEKRFNILHPNRPKGRGFLTG